MTHRKAGFGWSGLSEKLWHPGSTERLSCTVEQGDRLLYTHEPGGRIIVKDKQGGVIIHR